MAISIGRRRVIGIAKESSYGVAASAPSFLLQALETPTVEIVTKKIENTSVLGSSYAANTVKNAGRYSKLNIKFKISENVFPLILGQKFNISTTTVTGETAVYRHTLTYSNTILGASVRSYTIFIDDPDNGDIITPGVMFSKISLKAGDGFIECQAEGIGRYPTFNNFTPVITAPLEFTGRDLTAEYGDFSGSYSSLSLIDLEANYVFNLPDEGDFLALGSQDIATLWTLENKFEVSATSIYENNNIRQDYTNNTKKKLKIKMEDASRFVSGSVANTRPRIIMEYPAGYVVDWKITGGLSETTKQEYTFVAVNEPGVTNSPVSIEVINNVSSY